MANVEKLLLLQGGKCFYCQEPLSLKDATQEHVIARSMGGDQSEQNSVACCQAINQLFGDATPKEKLAAIINARGKIECPRRKSGLTALLTQPTAAIKAGIEELAEPLQAAYEEAARVQGGAQANLAALGVGLRKRVTDFAVSRYGYKQLGSLLKDLGYQVSGQWAVKPKGKGKK